MFSHKRVAAFKNLRIDLVKTNSVKLKSIMIGWSCKQRFAFKVSLSNKLPNTKILSSDKHSETHVRCKTRLFNLDATFPFSA